jgi:hypothetical protein
MIEIDVIDGNFIRELLEEIRTEKIGQAEAISRLNIHEESRLTYDIYSVLLIRCRRIFGIDLPDSADWTEYVRVLAEQRKEDWMTTFVFLLEYILRVRTA